MKREDDGLRAVLTSDGWSVVDEAGGRWWPSDEAREEIRGRDAGEWPSTSQPVRALRICREEPMRGRWSS